MFHNESCYIDGLCFDRNSLIERCLEMYWFRFFINFFIGIAMFLFVYPNMLSVPFIRWIVAMIILLNLIIIMRLGNISKKINRIFENGKIVKSNVIKELTYERLFYSRFVGQYHIHSVYFDDMEGKNISFCFRGHSDRPVCLLRPFKQGDEFRDITTINVLVNTDNYSDYFVLFREELNIDMSRNLYYKVLNGINYILWYGGVILFIYFTR